MALDIYQILEWLGKDDPDDVYWLVNNTSSIWWDDGGVHEIIKLLETTAGDILSKHLLKVVGMYYNSVTQTMKDGVVSGSFWWNVSDKDLAVSQMWGTVIEKDW